MVKAGGGNSYDDIADATSRGATSRGARDAMGDANLPGGNFRSPDNFPDVAPGGRAGGDVIPDVELQKTPIAKDAKALQDAPTPDVEAKAAQPNVQDAARNNASKLAKLGLKGALGVAALMILTGESNPIAAINSAVDAAEDTAEAARNAAKTGLDIFKKLTEFFSKYGLYVSLSSSCCILLFVLLSIRKMF